jgi:hypothetical protein
VKKDSSGTIASVTVNAGTNPAFVWQDSTQVHGWLNVSGGSSNKLVYKPQATGDKLRCKLTSNATCAAPSDTLSNVLVFTVQKDSTGGQSVLPADGGDGARLFPNPVSNQLTIDSLRTADQWETLDILSQTGQKTMATINIKGLTKVTVTVAGLQPGYYIVVIRKNDGSFVRRRFVKIN